MKKKIIISAAATVLMTSLFPLSVLADTTPGEIHFSNDQTETGAKDPDDPSQPATPGDGHNKETGNPGPLSLDVIPVKFDFGTVKASVTETTYQAKSTDRVQYIQVTDKRTDKNGWTVKAQRTEFLDENDVDGLAGSILTIPAGSAKNELTGSATPTGLQTTEAAMVAATEYTVFESENQNNAGKMSSVSSWAGDQVSLKIPGMTAKAKGYSATITWTLAAVATP
ncbi:WxL domain-containing protein [Enterococcus sp. LJL128]|uniref:WxL domain-containing protein n=1 Tax=Enterococcus sp. LJL51 TaxID=3416656 RepID=UPI003CF4C099